MHVYHIVEMEINNMAACRIINEEVAHLAAKLLQVDGNELVKSLTHRTTFAHGEVIVTPLSAAQALDVRDAFVKGIYGRVFIWIVNKINIVIYKEPVSNGLLLVFARTRDWCSLELGIGVR